MLSYLRAHLLLYPYRFSSILMNRPISLFPYRYYYDMLVDILKAERSYDTLPNFTASDIKRLLGISRNEYIDIINRARSKKFMWRINKGAILSNLLPKAVVPSSSFVVDYWWLVEYVDLPQHEFIKIFNSVLNEHEKRAIGLVKKEGYVAAYRLSLPILRSLYIKNLIYFTIPIEDSDYVVVPTLKNFIMNRKPTDVFEKMVYDMLVTLDERTTIRSIANVLDLDIGKVKAAVSLCLRCRFAYRRLQSGPGETELGIVEDSVRQQWVTRIAEYHSILDAKLGHDWIERLPRRGEEKKKRIGFLFDNSLTAHLMFGNLGVAIKEHAVTLFEIGKLTDEALDDFLACLDAVQTPDSTIGEARVYYNHAFSLRHTLRFLRRNEDYSFEDCDGGLELLRFASLEHLDAETKLKVLKTNYALIVSQVPLKASTATLPLCLTHFFGPPLTMMNSHWGRLYLYEKAHCGPPTLCFRRGYRVPFLMDRFLLPDRVVLVPNWDMDANVQKNHAVLQTINDSLLESPVVLQSLRNNYDGTKPRFLEIPFPYDDNEIEDQEEEGERVIPLESQKTPEQRDKVAIRGIVNQLVEEMHLGSSFGVITLLVVDESETERSFYPFKLEFGLPLENDELNRRLCAEIQRRRLFRRENIEQHDLDMKMLAMDFISFLERFHKYRTTGIETTDVHPTRNLYFDGTSYSNAFPYRS